jgi:hypothetical protein
MFPVVVSEHLDVVRLPFALVLQVHNVNPTAPRAIDVTIGPAQPLHVLQSVVGTEKNRMASCKVLGFIVLPSMCVLSHTNNDSLLPEFSR